jgi:hypothetical protein
MATAGCRDNGTLTPADLSMAGGGGGGGGGGGTDMAMTTKNYMMATVAMMRQGAPGDYELDNVLVVAKTSSSASPHLVIQDAAGGDFSGMYTTCSATSASHPCAATSDNKNAAVGDKLTIKGTFIKASNANGATETFYIDSITNSGPGGAAPAPAQVAITDITRNNGTMIKKWWFQRVVVTPAPASGALKIYDLVPAELVFTGTGCPKQVGFGLVPTATAACSGATVMCPATACAAPDASEVLIGTEFYKQFTTSSDCTCAKTDMGANSPLVTSSTTSMGAVSGVLLYDSVFGSSPIKTFLYLSPTSNTDLPLTNLN